MNLITSVRIFFNQKSRRELLIYYAVFMLIVLGAFIGIIASHFSTMARLTQQLKEVNKQRANVQHIILQNKKISAQQEAVKAILEQEPNFYIGQYFNDLLRSTPLAVTAGPELAETDVGNGFIERKLTATLSHITMKQLTEFLLKIEQKERVYTKELKITKDIKDGLLNATLTIATLEPQQTAA